MMYAVDSLTLRRRGFAIPPAAIAVAIRSAAGRRAVAALAGLGDNITIDLGGGFLSSKPELLDMLAKDVAAWANLPPNSPQATLDPAQQIAGDLTNYCAQFIGQADPNCDPATLQALVQQAAGNLVAGQNLAIDCSNPNNATYCYPGSPAYDLAINGGGGGTAYTVPPSITSAPVSTPAPSSPVPTGGGLATNPAATAVQYTFRNLSRPNQPMQPGDAWSLTIIGPPNSPVTIAGSQNGKSFGSTPFGNTDGSGTRVISGQMTAAEIGSWSETISVGQGVPAVLNFTVQAAPAAPGPTGGGGSTTTSSGSGSTGAGAGNTTPPPAPPANNSNLLLYGALAVAAFFMFTGSGGGRR